MLFQEQAAKIHIGLFELYEQLVRKKNPGMKCVTYTLQDVLNFIDQIYEISMLEYDSAQKGFRPHGRAWIKSLLQLEVMK